uniref:Uncharacterized protein n=1 Tax=Anguilla anguilla TaxID=7936 RepID=A0A0E9RG69_ANGAN
MRNIHCTTACVSLPPIIFKMGGWASSTDIHAPFVTEVLIWVSEVSAAISVVACILRTGGCGGGGVGGNASYAESRLLA